MSQEDRSDEVVAALHLNLAALRLAYKTTSDALRNWPGGDPEEQEYLIESKNQLFRCLLEHSLEDTKE